MTGSRTDRTEFWRRFGEALASGVRLTDALREGGAGGHRRIAEALALAVERGSSLSEALLDFPDLFESAVVSAVRRGEQSGTLDEAAVRISEALAAGDLTPLDSGREVAPAEAGVVAAVDALFEEARARNASDVHVDPQEDGTGLVRLRIDGVLQALDPVPAADLPAVIGHLKAMAGLDVAERRRAQDGRIVVRLRGADLDLRIASSPTVHGERVVARLLDPRQPLLRLDDVLPDGAEKDRIREMANLTHGLVVVNGPTGSGKTTTLYCMLAEANGPGISVVSVEDPVEYVLPGVVQMQVAPQFGFTFLAAQKAVLRQDPDVIMVGEIREAEQILLACQAAMTGHLVMTTLHARRSTDAVQRLLGLGVEPYLLNASLSAVVSQLLVRKLCEDCRLPTEPDPSLLPPEAVVLLEGGGDRSFHARGGCERCGRTGYRGRAAIHEILTVDEGVRRAIAEAGESESVAAAARAAGMKTFLEAGMQLAARGETTMEEVLRVALA